MGIEAPLTMEELEELQVDFLNLTPEEQDRVTSRVEKHLASPSHGKKPSEDPAQYNAHVRQEMDRKPFKL